MSICVNGKCEHFCEKHISNVVIEKGKTYSGEDFTKECDKE